MKITVWQYVLLFAVFASGCSQSPPIQRVSDSRSEFDSAVFQGEVTEVSTEGSNIDRYRVYAQGATGFVPQSAVRSNAEDRANRFCRQTNKNLKILQERNSVPPHVLGNWPRSELVFVCTEKPGPSLADDPRYAKLQSLKHLVDSGVLTQSEFEIEKAKILSEK